MNISVQKCLAKIEDELRLAKNCAGEEEIRKKVYSIKILCELILDNKPVSDAPLHTIKPANPEQHQTGMDLQPKKVDIEDANGDSLLDF